MEVEIGKEKVVGWGKAINEKEMERGKVKKRERQRDQESRQSSILLGVRQRGKERDRKINIYRQGEGKREDKIERGREISQRGIKMV